MSHQKENTTTTDPDSGTRVADGGKRDRLLAFADGDIPILEDIVQCPAPGEFDLDDILPERIPEQNPEPRMDEIEQVIQAVSESATERIMLNLEPRIRNEVEKAVRCALLNLEKAHPTVSETG